MEAWEIIEKIRDIEGDTDVLNEIVQWLNTDQLEELCDSLTKAFDLDFDEEEVYE